MKNTSLRSLFLFLTIVLFFSCRKEQELKPLSSPCTDVVTGKTYLTPAWTWLQGDLSSIYPAVFEQQVVFSRMVNENETELLGFDGASGQLLWQSTVPAYLYGDNYRQVGSRLYFANKSRTSLLSFDVTTRQLETAWRLPTPEVLAFQFAVQEGFAVCPTIGYMARRFLLLPALSV